jgi:fumarate reductase subunit D
MDGLILLVLIGALVAFGWTRLRGKMKLSVSGKSWLAPLFIVVVVVLMMWSFHNGH